MIDSRGRAWEKTLTQPCTPNRPVIRPKCTKPSGRDGLVITNESSGFGGLLQQISHALGRLGAFAQPVLHALHVHLQLGFLRGRQRVVKPDALGVVAVQRTTPVSDDDAVIGPLVRAATGRRS